MNKKQINLVAVISRGDVARTKQLLGNFNSTDLHFKTDNANNILEEAAATGNVEVMQAVLAAGNWTAVDRDQALTHVNSFIFERELAEGHFRGVRLYLSGIEHGVTENITEHREQGVTEFMEDEYIAVSGMLLGSAAL